MKWVFLEREREERERREAFADRISLSRGYIAGPCPLARAGRAPRPSSHLSPVVAPVVDPVFAPVVDPVVLPVFTARLSLSSGCIRGRWLSDASARTPRPWTQAHNQF